MIWCTNVKINIFRLISTLSLPTLPTKIKYCFCGDKEAVENITNYQQHPINVPETEKYMLKTKSYIMSGSRERSVLTSQCCLRHPSIALKSHQGLTVALKPHQGLTLSINLIMPTKNRTFKPC